MSRLLGKTVQSKLRKIVNNEIGEKQGKLKTLRSYVFVLQRLMEKQIATKLM